MLGSALKIGMPDPGREPVGVSMLFGVRDLMKANQDPGAALTTELRQLSPNTVSSVSDLFTRLPGTGSEEDPFDAFPVSENTVLRNNARESTPLVAAYADPAVPALDYPYVVLPDTKGSKRAAAEKFLTVLMTAEHGGRPVQRGLPHPGRRDAALTEAPRS